MPEENSSSSAASWTISNGRVIRGEGYGDRDEAREAAGLRE
jgi:hypothetical protein